MSANDEQVSWPLIRNAWTSAFTRARAANPRDPAFFLFLLLPPLFFSRICTTLEIDSHPREQNLPLASYRNLVLPAAKPFTSYMSMRRRRDRLSKHVIPRTSWHQRLTALLHGVQHHVHQDVRQEVHRRERNSSGNPYRLHENETLVSSCIKNFRYKRLITCVFFFFLSDPYTEKKILLKKIAVFCSTKRFNFDKSTKSKFLSFQS